MKETKIIFKYGTVVIQEKEGEGDSEFVGDLRIIFKFSSPTHPRYQDAKLKCFSLDYPTNSPFSPNHYEFLFAWYRNGKLIDKLEEVRRCTK